MARGRFHCQFGHGFGRGGRAVKVHPRIHVLHGCDQGLHHGFVEQVFLGREMLEQGRLVDAGGLGDVAGAGTGESAAGKHVLGSGDDLVAPLGSPPVDSLGSGLRGAGLGLLRLHDQSSDVLRDGGCTALASNGAAPRQATSNQLLAFRREARHRRANPAQSGRFAGEMPWPLQPPNPRKRPSPSPEGAPPAGRRSVSRS